MGVEEGGGPGGARAGGVVGAAAGGVVGAAARGVVGAAGMGDRLTLLGGIKHLNEILIRCLLIRLSARTRCLKNS